MTTKNTNSNTPTYTFTDLEVRTLLIGLSMLYGNTYGTPHGPATKELMLRFASQSPGLVEIIEECERIGDALDAAREAKNVSDDMMH